MNKTIRHLVLATLAALNLAGAAHAQEAAIRKNLAERVPQLPKIDEVRSTPVAGLYEVRIGTDVFYSDAQGNFIIQGQLIDTKTKRNITEERLDKLAALDFDNLPVKDAFTIVRGNGKRKMAVFQDPNCPYCKKFERDMQEVKDVTIYMYLYPILGADSALKARNIWCAKDRAQTWTDWMVRDKLPVEGTCDTAAMGRNVEFGRKYKINGTPTLIFADGSRLPGAVAAAEVEKRLASAK